MSDRVLCVDDDKTVLEVLRRVLSPQFVVVTAGSGAEGMQCLQHQGPFAVVMTDHQMPGISGLRFLMFVRESAPDTVRIMLTAYADMKLAMDAVNEGAVFRFLTKPFQMDRLQLAVQAGAGQYHLVIAERELLELTLQGSIRVLLDILATTNPTAHAQSVRVTGAVVAMARCLSLPYLWQVECAAMLAPIGLAVLPKPLVDKYFRGEPLTASEGAMLAQYPATGSALLQHIPRMGDVAGMIAHQQFPAGFWQGKSAPTSERIRVGAQLLLIATTFERARVSGEGVVPALARLDAAPATYDPSLVAALRATMTAQQGGEQRKSIPVTALQDGMVISRDLLTRHGLLLLKGLTAVTPVLHLRLQNYLRQGEIEATVEIVEYGRLN